MFAMKLDIEKYLPMTSGLDMSRTQKEEMIRIVWGLMESCVDQAFGVHPVQNVAALQQKMLSKTKRRGIESKRKSCKNQFNRAAGRSAA